MIRDVFAFDLFVLSQLNIICYCLCEVVNSNPFSLFIQQIPRDSFHLLLLLLLTPQTQALVHVCDAPAHPLSLKTLSTDCGNHSEVKHSTERTVCPRSVLLSVLLSSTPVVAAYFPPWRGKTVTFLRLFAAAWSRRYRRTGLTPEAREEKFDLVRAAGLWGKAPVL